MFIGGYLCASSIVFLLGLLGLVWVAGGNRAVPTFRERALSFSYRSLPAFVVIFEAFVGFSASFRLMSFWR
jgi:hypothetical protein